METNEVVRGRLIDHLQLVVADVKASRKFYEAVLAPLDIKIQMSTDEYFAVDELFVSSKNSAAAQGHLTGRTHLAFQASSREMVDKFYRAGLEAGGRDNGKPGERAQYHPGYYGAFLIDPDGNNIEAVYHGPAKRSAPAVKITWD